MTKFVITAGHATVDKPDSGAVYNGVKESELMTEFRNIVALKLRQRGHTVITDGEGAANQTLNTAISLIRNHQPDYACSNGGGNHFFAQRQGNFQTNQ